MWMVTAVLPNPWVSEEEEEENLLISWGKYYLFATGLL